MTISSRFLGAIVITLAGSSAALAETYVVEAVQPSRVACYEKVYVPARVAVVGTTYWVPPPVRQWRYNDPGHAFADPLPPSPIATIDRLRVVERDHHTLRQIDCP